MSGGGSRYPGRVGFFFVFWFCFFFVVVIYLFYSSCLIFFFFLFIITYLFYYTIPLSSLTFTGAGQNTGETVNRFLSVGATPYSTSEVEAKNHNYELVKNTAGTVVHVDVKQMGVGGDCSWSCDILDKYKIHPGNYTYQFYIRADE
jgi:hypothetical protein